MNKTTILTWLIIVMIAVSGCGNGVTPPPTEGPAAVIDGQLKEVLAYTLPPTTPLEAWTIPIRVAPFEEIKDYKYKLPDDWPQEAAPPSQVGVVEIGSGAETPGQYVVAIDTVSATDTVSGLIASTTNANAYLVAFDRVAQSVNPDRGPEATIEEFKSLPPAPDVAVAIRSDSVCFVVKTEKYFRYCSGPQSMLSVRDNFPSQYQSLQDSVLEAAPGVGVEPGNLETDHIISEMEDPNRLDHCGQQILGPAQAIQAPQPTPTDEAMTHKFEPPVEAAVPDQPKPSLQFSNGEKLVAENQAALQAACGSDITVAAVTLDYFNQNYQKLQTPASNRWFMLSLLAPFFTQAGPTPITVAVVQILQPVDTSLGTVFPGNYRLDFWFDANGDFYAATITGTLEDGITPVTDQPVPAVPATFENEDGSEQSGVQISTARMFGRCTFFQSTCS